MCSFALRRRIQTGIRGFDRGIRGLDSLALPGSQRLPALQSIETAFAGHADRGEMKCLSQHSSCRISGGAQAGQLATFNQALTPL